MSNLLHLARTLRSNPTDAEKKLWQHLRQRRFHNLKFRRQQGIDHYIADFICFEKRLVIELDGGQHSQTIEQDQQRTEVLKSKGFIVLRFWNNDVLSNIEGVLQEIESTINLTPSP